MSEEGGSTNENGNLSGNKVSTLTPTEPEILAPLTEGGSHRRGDGKTAIKTTSIFYMMLH
jgi:hypothetical protein